MTPAQLGALIDAHERTCGCEWRAGRPYVSCGLREALLAAWRVAHDAECVAEMVAGLRAAIQGRTPARTPVEFCRRCHGWGAGRLSQTAIYLICPACAGLGLVAAPDPLAQGAIQW